MSRHRNFRNRQYSYDYDDDYDDYYEEEEELDPQQQQYVRRQQQQPPQQQQQTQQGAQQQQQEESTTKTKTLSEYKREKQQQGQRVGKGGGLIGSQQQKGGVTLPPPGFGRPASASTAASGVTTATPASPPPGWTRPAKSSSASSPLPTTTQQKKNRQQTRSKSPQRGGGTSAAVVVPQTPPPSGGGGGGGLTGVATPTTTTFYPKPKPPTENEIGKDRKSRLSMVVLGHVDAGKSTLMGQLLLQVGKVEQRVVNKYQRQANEVGKSSFALAWVMDEDESERVRGVTMDVATKTMTTDRHDITILDAPGHRDFIPAMITGAASADVGLLVVAATTGEFEAGFDLASGRGQTREHILLSRGVGVSQLIVAVNKLDAADPPWSEDRFKAIQSQIMPFLTTCGFQPRRVKFVPLSGLTGENVKERRTSRTEDGDGVDTFGWYKGPTLLEAMNEFVPAQRSVDKPLRLIANDVYPEGKGVTVRGRIVQGFLRSGATVVALPIGDVGNVGRIEHGDLVSLDEGGMPSFNSARAGDNVEVFLTGIDVARINAGFVICHANEELRVPVKRKMEARILVMDKIPVPIIRGSQVTLHMHSIDVPATLTRLLSVTRKGAAAPSSTPTPNGNDLSVKRARPPRVVTGGMSAQVEITLSEKICLECFSQCRSLGRFVLRRGGETVAVGVIEKLLG